MSCRRESLSRPRQRSGVQALSTRPVGRASGNNDSERYGAIGMQAFEIFKITVEKWVLVVPLNFKRDESILELPDVVNFVGLSFLFHAVYCPLDHEVVLAPASRSQCVAQSLRPLGLSPARANDLLDWYCGGDQDLLEFGSDVWKVTF